MVSSFHNSTTAVANRIYNSSFSEMLIKLSGLAGPTSLQPDSLAKIKTCGIFNDAHILRRMANV